MAANNKVLTFGEGNANYNNYVAVGSLPKDTSTHSFTFETWVKATVDGTKNMCLAAHEQPNNVQIGSFYLGFHKADAAGPAGLHFKVNEYRAFSVLVTDFPSKAPNSWEHIAVTYTSTGKRGQAQAKVYINGLLKSNVVWTYKAGDDAPLPLISAPVSLGAFRARGGNLDPFTGQMDEVRFWNTVRTQAEIQEYMGKSVPANTPGLEAYYKFDEEAPDLGTAKDSSGNGNDGHLQGFSNPVPPRDDANNKDFDNTDPNNPGGGGAAVKGAVGFTAPVYAYLRHKPYLNLVAPFTLEALVNPTAVANGGNLVIVNKGRSYQLAISPTGKYMWALDGDSEALWKWNETPAAVPANQWTHLALTYDGTKVSPYVNGAAQPTTAMADNLVANSKPLEIGDNRENAGDVAYEGQITEVRIWSEARSAQQIADGKGKAIQDPANEAALLAYYPMEKAGDDYTVKDHSKNANDGETMNGPGQWPAQVNGLP